ncbi:MAG: M48 family metalloprotease [Planctomycetota bacterium]|nr:MAG: M48 family metalloprotease [Planctomycetota bacterium]
MAGLSYEFGRKIGGLFRKGKWMARSLSGSESVTIRAEFEAGRDLARRFEKDIDSDPSAQQVVGEIGSRLVARLIHSKRRFCFRVLSSAETNAFALPGGFIFVTRALLELCQWDRDEVACILGHEIGHVVKGHAIDRLWNEVAIGVATHVVSGRGLLNKVVKQAGTQLLQSAYSQDQELKADEYGYDLSESAGFNQQAAFGMLRRLQNKKGMLGNSVLSIYFSSHPPIDLRISNLNRHLQGKRLWDH